MPQIITGHTDQEDCRDFVADMEPDDGIWLTIDPFAVYIKRTDEGIIIDVYENGKESNESMASIAVMDSDIEGIEVQ